MHMCIIVYCHIICLPYQRASSILLHDILILALVMAGAALGLALV